MNAIRIINTKDGQTAKQFDTIQWCLKAVSRDDTRQKLKHLYIDKDFMAGCDGYRLHIALNGIPSFYCNMDRNRELDNKSYLAYHVYMNTRNCYNLKYLEDIRMEGNMQFEMDENKSLLVIASEDNDRLAMLMPLFQ